VIRDPIEQGHRRSLPGREQRAEFALRARSLALRERTGAVGRCPGCGRAVSSEESWMSVGALVVHPDCLFS
jgi:hypothetical protein